jgi:hypothetical protein
LTIAANLRDLFIMITQVEGRGYGWAITHGESRSYRELLIAEPDKASFEEALNELREILELCCRGTEGEDAPTEDVSMIGRIIASLQGSSRNVETRLLVAE